MTSTPAHLVGRLSQFEQKEPGGSVSFLDLKNSNGLGDSRVEIPLEQYKQTFDPAYRNLNFEDSMLGQYGNSKPTNLSSQIRDWTTQKLKDGLDWGVSSQGKAVGTAGLLSALVGGGIGAVTAARSGESGALSRGALYALLAGSVGAGGVALAQNFNNKREKVRTKSASVEDDLVRAVMSDRQMDDITRSQALRAIYALPKNQASELSTLVRMMGGAAAGVVIVRFLKAKGLMSSIAGGIIGALLGAASGGSKTTYNKLGQPSTRRYG